MNQTADIWADIILASEAMGEPFEDVHIVTLKSVFMDRVHEEAMRLVSSITDSKQVAEAVEHIIRVNPPQVREFVSLTLSNCTIAIDIDVIDDDSIWIALNKLSIAMSTLNGEPGIVHMGQPRTYAADEVLLPSDCVHQHI